MSNLWLPRALAPGTTIAVIVGVLVALSSIGFSHAGPGHSGDEGHSHDAPAAVSAQSPRVIATSENYQLVGILKNNRLTIYLDREADNVPVANARIEVSYGDKTFIAENEPNAVYSVPAGAFASGSEHDLLFSISDGEMSDLLGAILIVPPAHHGNEHNGHAHIVPAYLSGNSLVFGTILAFAAIFAAGFITIAIFRRNAPLPVLLLGGLLISVAGPLPVFAGPGHSGDEGHSHGPETAAGASDFPRRLLDGSVFFPKPTQRLVEVRARILQPETLRRTIRMPGRIIANPSKMSIIHPTVQGRLKPPAQQFARLGQAVKAGDVLAYVQPTLAAIDRSDVEQTGGQLDQEIALAQNRVEQFRKFSTFPAERVRTAEIELEALKRRKESLVRRQTGNETLVAPIDGEIIAVNGSIGQLVSPQDTVFKVVDTSNLWVEALSYEDFDLSKLGKVHAAINGAELKELRFVGRSSALEQQTAVFHFQLLERVPVPLGRSVAVFAEIGDPVSGLVVPRQAIVQSPNGQFVVFKHVEPERFEPKLVRFAEIDSTRALITAGIEPGEKIVVDGASLINQVR